MRNIGFLFTCVLILSSISGPSTVIGKTNAHARMEEFRSSEEAGNRLAGWFVDCTPVGTPALLYPPEGTLFYADAAGSPEHQLSWTQPPGVTQFIEETYNDQTGALLERKTLDINTVFIHFFAVEGTYRWRVRAVNPVEGCDPGPWTAFWKYKIVHILTYPVINLRATQGTIPDRVRLSWMLDDAQREGYVSPERFIILRAASLLGQRQPLDQLDPSARSYDDLTALPGVHYFYWVKSYNEMVFDTTSDPAEGWAQPEFCLECSLFLPLVAH